MYTHKFWFYYVPVYVSLLAATFLFDSLLNGRLIVWFPKYLDSLWRCATSIRLSVVVSLRCGGVRHPFACQWLPLYGGVRHPFTCQWLPRYATTVIPIPATVDYSHVRLRTFTGAFVNTAAMKRIQMSAMIDQATNYVVVAQVQVAQRDAGVQYTPHIEITIPGTRPITLDGSVFLNGQKQIKIDLNLQNALADPITMKGLCLI